MTVTRVVDDSNPVERLIAILEKSPKELDEYSNLEMLKEIDMFLPSPKTVMGYESQHALGFNHNRKKLNLRLYLSDDELKVLLNCVKYAQASGVVTLSDFIRRAAGKELVRMIRAFKAQGKEHLLFEDVLMHHAFEKFDKDQNHNSGFESKKKE